MTHPVLQGMVLTGCQNQQAIFLAFHTYMELSEVEVLWNIEFHYNKVLDLIYISSSDKSNREKGNLYVPIPCSKIITPDWISQIQKEMEEKHQNSTFTFVIKDQDSTSVHYKISRGLVPPLSPEAAKRKKLSDEKRQLFECEMKKRKSELFTAAKNAASKCDSVTQEKPSKKNDECDDVTVVHMIDVDSDCSRLKQVEVIEL